MNRAQTIEMNRSTAANHRRVGNIKTAERMEAKAATYEAMSDVEFIETRREPSAAVKASCARMANDLIRRTRS